MYKIFILLWLDRGNKVHPVLKEGKYSLVDNDELLYVCYTVKPLLKQRAQTFMSSAFYEHFLWKISCYCADNQ